ncbi:MAG: hypothetical protein M1816_003686 [Peltula sp. TS41687]|nr:MAG: hypothetical protein M1816_003686 [Peltula sp. TS41687]
MDEITFTSTPEEREGDVTDPFLDDTDALPETRGVVRSEQQQKQQSTREVSSRSKSTVLTVEIVRRMVDFRNPQYQFPHGIPIQPAASGNVKLKPLTQIVPVDHHHQNQAISQATAAHNRSRTASSSVFPGMIPSTTSTTTITQQHITSAPYPNINSQGGGGGGGGGKHSSRRSLSNATASTSTTGALTPARSTSNSFSLRRSPSSRSNGAATGYVALMRKQKATVWCDRSQYEDPRLAAQQKAARLRAAREVVGSPSGSSTGGGSGSLTTGRRTKIRHHANNNMVDYSQASFVGGVPMRLSASEVGDEGYNREDDGESQYVFDAHRRTASGRSSSGSGRRSTHMDARMSHPNQANPATLARFSEGRPPSSTDGSEGGSPDNAITPMPHHHHQHHYHQQQQQQGPPGGGGYFIQPGGTGISGGSGDSAERENSFGDVGQMVPSAQQTSKSSALGREKSHRTPDELRRRGSVDDRAMTMSTGRLYVANPDLSD